LPDDGFLLLGEKRLSMVREQYAGEYDFIELERSGTFNELNDEIVVCQIVKLKLR